MNLVKTFPAVTHDLSGRRFEVRLGAGLPASLSYTFADDLVIFEHTEVPDELRGQGLAAHLVRAALTEARQRHWRIIPRCEYVAGFIARHAEFADLINPLTRPMNQAKLYLIKPHFVDQGETYYCPGCAEMTGLLEFYPALKQHIEIAWVEFARPRPELVTLLGRENQSCPVLVLHSVPSNLPAQLKVQQVNDHAFVAGAREIGEYLAHVHGIGLPH